MFIAKDRFSNCAPEERHVVHISLLTGAKKSGG
jgi:hypothetical protein